MGIECAELFFAIGMIESMSGAMIYYDSQFDPPVKYVVFFGQALAIIGVLLSLGTKEGKVAKFSPDYQRARITHIGGALYLLTSCLAFGALSALLFFKKKHLYALKYVLFLSFISLAICTFVTKEIVEWEKRENPPQPLTSKAKAPKKGPKTKAETKKEVEEKKTQ